MVDSFMNKKATMRPVALTIAGSDSGGGAGIQADLHTFAALDVHGLSAITAITAQNTRAVTAVWPVPASMVTAQLAALFDDFPIAAIKIGMLGSVEAVHAVVDALHEHRQIPLVLDPVMIATSGSALASDEVANALKEYLIPLASVITPNLPEAEKFLGCGIDTNDALTSAATALRELGAKNVLIKGGHATGSGFDNAIVRDVLVTESAVRTFESPRQPIEGHGTGCTLAAAIAARLALGDPLEVAIATAIAFVQRALHHSYRPGRGTLSVLNHAAARPLS